VADEWHKAGLAQREQVIFKDLVSVIGDVLAEALKQRDERISALEARLAQLEGAKAAALADAFQGPWLQGKAYARGALTQRNRRVWLALVSTTEQPGASSDWREFPLGPERAA